jgi:uncharacterized protein with beta-barrel porin domain
MAKIPLPERGQPLDVTYISQLAQAVNELSSAISPATYKYTSIDTPNAGKQNIKGSEARVIGGYVRVVNSGTITAGEEKSFTYSFAGEFKYTPIATATAINTGNTIAGKNVTIVLKSITTSGLEGIVRFNTSGDVSIDVNLIIIGVPN